MPNLILYSPAALLSALSTVSNVQASSATSSLLPNSADSIPPITPPVPSSETVSWLLSYLDPWLDWVAKQITNVAENVFPSPTLEEHKVTMAYSERMFYSLATIPMSSTEFDKEAIPILSSYLRSSIVCANRDPSFRDRLCLKKLKYFRWFTENYNASRSSEILDEAIEQLTKKIKKLEQTPQKDSNERIKRNKALTNRLSRRQSFSDIIYISDLVPPEGQTINGPAFNPRVLADCGDFDNDGILGDMAIGSPGEETVYILSGNTKNISTVDVSNPNNLITKIVSSDLIYFGVNVQCKDLTLDGRPDLIVSATSANGGIGRTYVIYNQASFPSEFAIENLNVPDFPQGSIINAQTGYGFGQAITTGDMQQDGNQSLIISQSYAYHGNLFVGTTYIIFQSPQKMLPTNFNIEDLNTENNPSGSIVISDETMGLFGSTLTYLKNGDGKGTLIIGEYFRYNNNYGQGAVHGIHNQNVPFPSNFNTSQLNTAGYPSGFILYSSAGIGNLFGYKVAKSDVNGDGREELLACAYGLSTTMDTDNPPESSSLYIIYGQENLFPPAIALNQLNTNNNPQSTQVFNPNSASFCAALGGGGKINGNQYEAIAVSTPYADNLGQVTVLFGQEFLPPFVLLSNLNKPNNPQGFEIIPDGDSSWNYFGQSIEFIYNNDGSSNLASSSFNNIAVVFGQGITSIPSPSPSPTPLTTPSPSPAPSPTFPPNILSPILDLSHLDGTNGFPLNLDAYSRTVSIAPNRNYHKAGDIYQIIIDSKANAAKLPKAGTLFIFLAPPLSNRAFNYKTAQPLQIYGEYAHGQFGDQVIYADINCDGKVDVITAAPFANLAPGLNRAGAIYILWGDKLGSAPITLSNLGNQGVRIAGIYRNGALGSVLLTLDFNGDGCQDLAAGIPTAGLSNKPQSGVVFILWGRPNFSDIDLSKIEGAGMQIVGARKGDKIGTTLAPASDSQAYKYQGLLITGKDTKTQFIVNGGETSSTKLSAIRYGKFFNNKPDPKENIKQTNNVSTQPPKLH